MRSSRLRLILFAFQALGLVGSVHAHTPRRPAWTASHVVGTPEPPPPYRVEQAFPALRFNRGVDMVTAPGSDRLFVAQLNGTIVSFPNAKSVDHIDPFCNLAERGGPVDSLYSLTFHPQFRTNHQLFVVYITAPDQPEGSHVSRFLVSDSDPPRCDPRSEEILLRWPSGGHNGSTLQFGRDGYLYISTGDGSAPFPPDQFAVGQTLQDLMSSVLRIDVDHRSARLPYTIPTDNPFVARSGARPEVWAYGFRNPWRMSIDLPTGDLWVGDVGWETWEMIDRVQRGGNYGWSVKEGPMNLRGDVTPGPTPILPPVISHPHSEARSITGGRIYRGQALPDLRGAYVYGDFETGKIWGLRYDAATAQVTWRQEIADTHRNLVTFGVDARGELYTLDYGGNVMAKDPAAGAIYRLVPNATTNSSQAFPRHLSETGLMQRSDRHSLASGVLPYKIGAEPWADGAQAQRFVALPGSSRIEVGPTWGFPAGTVLGKTLTLPRKMGQRQQRIETQILHFDGNEWRGYSYRWREDQSDATLVDKEGDEGTYSVTDTQGERQQRWHFGSRGECATCHNGRTGPVEGFTPGQLSGVPRQLANLVAAGVLSTSPPPVAPLVDPYRAGNNLTDRARSYLHANCAPCHHFGAGALGSVELAYDLKLPQTHTVGEKPLQGAFGIADAEVIAGGDPSRSVLLYRMSTLGSGRMPRLGSHVVDARGLALLEEWITSLPPPTATPSRPQASDSVAAAWTLRRSMRQVGEEGEALLARTFTSTGGALILARALDEKRIPAPLWQSAVEQGNAHERAEIRGLFERFIPEEQRTPRLGETIDPQTLLRMPGDPGRGRKLFFGTSAACTSCHQVGAEGRPFGPALTHIGTKYAPNQLLENILQPSKTIDPLYRGYVVQTTDGRTFVGRLQERTAQTTTLVDSQMHVTPIPTARVRELIVQEQSPMPEGLLGGLTRQEAADLLAFLISLK